MFGWDQLLDLALELSVIIVLGSLYYIYMKRKIIASEEKEKDTL